MDGAEAVAMVVILPTLFGTVGYVFKSAVEGLRRSRMARMQMDLQSKMIDKFGNSQDFVAWLQSEGGKQFLEQAPVEKTRPYGRIMNTIQIGIVLVVLAGGLLLLRAGLGQDAQEPLLVMGSIGLALGLGMLGSAGATMWLSKHWGLINGHSEGR